MEYYSAIKKNTFESLLMRQMKLEPIIQSEVSQKEKHQYSGGGGLVTQSCPTRDPTAISRPWESPGKSTILMHIYGI